MRKQIATISILVLFLVFSGSSVKVSAGGGACSIPSCRPKAQETSPPKSGAPLIPGQAASQLATAQAQDRLSLVLLAVQCVMGFPYFS